MKAWNSAQKCSPRRALKRPHDSIRIDSPPASSVLLPRADAHISTPAVSRQLATYRIALVFFAAFPFVLYLERTTEVVVRLDAVKESETTRLECFAKCMLNFSGLMTIKASAVPVLHQLYDHSDLEKLMSFFFLAANGIALYLHSLYGRIEKLSFI